MVVYGKIYLAEQRNNKIYIYLYFILGRVKTQWNFSSMPKDFLDIYSFPTLHMTEIHFLLAKSVNIRDIFGYTRQIPK